MSFILGISEGSVVAIGSVLLTLIISAIGAFFIMKTKTDKGDILTQVDKRIDEKLIPIEKRLEKHDDDINKLITKQEVIHTNVANILTGQSDHKEEFKSRMTKLESLIGKLFDKLDAKKDK